MTHVSGNVKALLHLNKFLVLLGQNFLHGGKRFKSENLVLVFLGRFLCTTLVTLNPSGYTIHNVDAPLSGACHVLWGPTGTPWGRAEGCNM